MIRKSLFWGLTLVLIAALISLVVRGRRLEKQQAQQVVEVVRESKPTPTRVFAPADLQIARASMQLENEQGSENSARVARHKIEIRNTGSFPYSDIQLKFTYKNRAGKELATRTETANQKILPGTTVALDDILITDIPALAADSTASIVSADMATK